MSADQNHPMSSRGLTDHGAPPESEKRRHPRTRARSEPTVTSRHHGTQRGATGPIQVRRAYRRHIPHIAELEHAARVNLGETDPAWAAAMQDPDREVWTLVAGESVVGALRLHMPRNTDTVCIEAIRVRPGIDRQGWSSRLLGQATRTARTRQRTILQLTIETDDENALSFYRAHGFQPTSDTKTAKRSAPGAARTLMVKQLEPLEGST